MNEEQKRLLRMLKDAIPANSKNTPPDEEFVKEVLDTLGFLFKSLDKSQILDVQEEFMSQSSIHLSKGVVIQTKHAHWFLNKKSKLDMYYWDRYSQHLQKQKGFSNNVVNSMDDILDEMVDLAGDPDVKDEFQRKGLVIGDVQSGKTANYIGLIAKAADVGYKVIVILTGTIEKLRSQTQQRVDEGFIGRDSNYLDGTIHSPVGVGDINGDRRPFSLTSERSDFNAQTSRAMSYQLNATTEPTVFVIKKNVSVLRSLNNWFKRLNGDSQGQIDHSILVIDDESDNASINTNSEDSDPTQTNKLIRKLLAQFNKASYVGFTATPYANIFINPDTEEGMKNQDLFPKDYIYCLDAPSNYIGARNIFPTQSQHHEMLIPLDRDEIEKVLPIKHKKNIILETLPESLLEAVRVFFLQNTIRDLREENIKTHRSMLINASRFVNVQGELQELVNGYVKRLQQKIIMYGKESADEAEKNSTDISELHETYKKYYGNLVKSVNWNDILASFRESCTPIKTVVVNQKNKNMLDYDQSPDGIRVIAIGGLALSRGLTLEGLSVSYFYRNSKTYDTLMQMGRWFGYKAAYADLCKVYMPAESIEWYQYISSSTDELRESLKEYRTSNLTPMEFGIEVREGITGLTVTAGNKMRSAEKHISILGFSGRFLETPKIDNLPDENEKNIKRINSFIAEINRDGYKVQSHQNDPKLNKQIGIYDLPAKYVVDLLSDLHSSKYDFNYDPDVITSTIRRHQSNELKSWDVHFASGQSERLININGQKLAPVQRSFSLPVGGDVINISGSKRRLGSTGDGRFGLTTGMIRQIESLHDRDGSKKTLNQNDYFSLVSRKPVLTIYFIELKENNDAENEDAYQILQSQELIKHYGKHGTDYLIGISVGVPKLKGEDNQKALYRANRVMQGWSTDEEDG